MRADGDAGAGGQDGPDASDENILLGHGVDHLLGGTFGVEQEAVGLGGDVGVAVAVEPLEGFLADAGVDALAFGNQERVFYAGEAATSAVMGMKFQPERSRILSSKSGRATANPQRRPAMPKVLEKVRMLR